MISSRALPPAGIPDLELVVRRADNLDDFVHRRKGSTKISNETRAFCHKIFEQFDLSCDGEIQSTELVPLLSKLMQFMGILVDDEVHARLQAEAPVVLETFDADGNGILDFEEFLSMISQVAATRPYSRTPFMGLRVGEAGSSGAYPPLQILCLQFLTAASAPTV